MFEQIAAKLIEVAFSQGGAIALAGSGGWLMFFWSEWRRSQQSREFADKFSEITRESHASQLATVKVLEGFRSDLLRGRAA